MNEIAQAQDGLRVLRESIRSLISDFECDTELDVTGINLVSREVLDANGVVIVNAYKDIKLTVELREATHAQNG